MNFVNRIEHEHIKSGKNMLEETDDTYCIT